MPGFNICGTGALTETNVDGKVEIRRNYRWYMQVSSMTGKEWAYLKKANRPNMKLGTLEQYHNQEKIWHMGQTTWEDLSCTFYDIEKPDVSKGIYEWLKSTTYGINEALPLKPSEYKKDVEVHMLDNAGAKTESWKYCHAWPFDVKWNELDYSSEAVMEIDVVFKFDRAQKIL